MNKVTVAEICIMCHWSSECKNCCLNCKDQCNGCQNCGINDDQEALWSRWEAWNDLKSKKEK